MVSGPETPFKGVPFAVGQTIEAEDYNNGGEGIAYHDLDTSNRGGQYRTGEGVDVEAGSAASNGFFVGFGQAGEWTDYTVKIATAGNYDIAFQIRGPVGNSVAGAGATFHAEVAGVHKTGELTITSTATSFGTITAKNVSLAAGTYVMRIVLDTNATGNKYAANLDSFKITPVPITLPAVSVAATDASATEAGDTGTFTVTRTGPTAAALTVGYATTGTATTGTDYAALTGGLIIPAGKASATITVTPKADAVAESAETVLLTLKSASAYTLLAGKTAGTITIADRPLVSITATDASASETGDTGTFTVSRSGATSSALTVGLSVSGTATNGTDDNTLPGSVVIPAGKSSVTIVVTSKSDVLTESAETVIASLSSNAAYAVDTARPKATVTIADVPVTTKPTVSIVATDASASESGDTGTFTISRTGSTSAALTVGLTVSGTATNGTDYTSITSTVTIPAGQATAKVVVNPKTDTVVESTESVIVKLSSGPYTIDGAKASATVSIADVQLTGGPVVTSISGPGTVFSVWTLTGKFAVGVTTVVRVFDSNGFSVDLTPNSVTATQITVTVPPYVNLKTGRLASGPLKVLVTQPQVPKSLLPTVANPAATPIVPSNITTVTLAPLQSLPTNRPAGTIYLLYLKAMRDSAIQTLAYIQSNNIDTPTLKKSVTDELGAINQQVAAVEQGIPTGSVSFTGATGKVTLNAGNLADADALLVQIARQQAATLNGVDSAEVFVNAATNPNISQATIGAAAKTDVRSSYAQDVTDGAAFGKTMGTWVTTGLAVAGLIVAAPEIAVAAAAIGVATVVTDFYAAGALSYSSIYEQDPIERNREQRAASNFFTAGVVDAVKQTAGNLIGKPYSKMLDLLGLDSGIAAADADAIPKLSIVAEQPHTVESAGNQGLIVVNVLKGTATGFKVAWTISGSADNAVDYQKLPTTETFLSVDGSRLELPIVAISDENDKEGIETATLTLINKPTDPYLVLGDASATVQIADRPTFSISASPAEVPKGGVATFTVTRNVTAGTPAWGSVKVEYTQPGSAKLGVDYISSSAVPLIGNVSFADGERTKTLGAQVLSTPSSPTEKQIVLQLTNSLRTRYLVSGSTSGTVKIIDRPIVSITASDNSAREGGTITSTGTFDPQVGTYKVSITSALKNPLVVKLAIDTTGTDTAVAADLVGSLPASVTIPAGQTSVTFDVSAKADTLLEPLEHLTVKIVPDTTNYSISTSAPSAVVDIIDNVNGRVTGHWVGSINLQTPFNGLDGTYPGNTTIKINGQMDLQLTALDLFTTGGFAAGGISGIVNSLTGFSAPNSTDGATTYKNYKLNLQPAPLDNAGTFGLNQNDLKPIKPADAFDAYMQFGVAADRYDNGVFIDGGLRTTQQVKCHVVIVGDKLTGTFSANGATGTFTLNRQA